VRGDRALAVPQAEKLAAEIAGEWGVEVRELRAPDDLSAIVADLRTLGMFEPGKLYLVVDTGLFADRAASGDLLVAVRQALPFAGSAADLTGEAREAAVRLLRICRLHDVDLDAGAANALGRLPDALLTGKSKSGADAVREELEPLLAAALESGLRGTGDDQLGELADLMRDGLPPRHLLILVESAVADRHPLVAALESRGALFDAGRLRQEKGTIAGLDRLVGELESETGARLGRGAVAELARRTLRGEDSRRGGAAGAIDADSATRFAAEFRKLAALAVDGAVDRELVAANVEDRGQEEVWPILDALGAGDAAAALEKIGRRLESADDRLAERLSLFALLSGFARHLVAVGGVMAATKTRAGESSYPRFKERLAPRLQGEVEGLTANPLRGMHAFRLHRLYQAASRWSAGRLAELPARTLETERRLKGDSGEPEAALAAFVVALAGPLKSAPAGAGGNRARAAGGGRS